MATHAPTPTEPARIETDFIIDYGYEVPRRMVRLTMDADAVRALRQVVYAAGDHGQHVNGFKQDVSAAFTIAAFLGRVESELRSRSLFSQEEFKATKPEPGANL